MLDKAYNPESTEDAMYANWRNSSAFTPSATGEPFAIMMPPPNATGQLHLGHAVMLALEDIFTRFARMNGKSALWLPGTDHAAIATENVVIAALKKQGMRDPRKELGRDGVLQKIREFVEQSQDTIRSQVAKMGSSCDWTREAYTMDDVRSACVQKVFRELYEAGLIYRGKRIVHWDPVLQTNVSDDEVDYKECTDPFYVFRYGPFSIGTVRPETKFADKYIVVHPDDERYSQYSHLQQFEVEWINGPITATLIKDEVADMEMGTGAMTITPWHSQVDFDLAKKYNLPVEQIIDFDGKLLPIAGEFSGMHISKARALIVDKLQQKNLIESTNEHYVHSIAVNSRGGGIIEPQVKEQWFIDVQKPVNTWKGKWSGKTLSIKEVMQDVIRSGHITIIPERFEKTYFHWIDNLRDWCISRQIWWGHRIPAWQKDGQWTVDPAMANEPGYAQDTDTLDTWFSSALWTFSTLADSNAALDSTLTMMQVLDQSPDYAKFHPTAILETGYDILPFWVARMILMTTYITGDVPFKTVYLHGLIRDKNGQKMSKSKPETMIDPLEIIPKYGADALRLSMIVGQSPGNDSRLYEEKIAGYRNFINKLWNASRYVLMKCEEAGINPLELHSSPEEIINNLSPVDKELFSRLQKLIDNTTIGIKNYKLSEVGELLYNFVWEDFCDWYLEFNKSYKTVHAPVYAIRIILKLLHPYIPFVTEKLWQKFNYKDSNIKLLINESWPKSQENFRFDEEEITGNLIRQIITTIRKIKVDSGLELSKSVNILLVTDLKNHARISTRSDDISRLAKVDKIFWDGEIKSENFYEFKYEKSGDSFIEKKETILIADLFSKEKVSSVFLKDLEIHVSLEGLVNKSAEKEKLITEQSKLEGFIAGITAKLSNEKFVSSAPESVVNLEREKLASNTEKLQKIRERLKEL